MQAKFFTESNTPDLAFVETKNPDLLFKNRGFCFQFIAPSGM